MLWAVGCRPLLVLPAELFERMSGEQQNTLLLHELAHLRRGDHLVRVLEFVVCGLYWWHPVVWYACRELRETEEQCCDAWVVSTLPGSGRTYALALVETLDFLSEARAAVPLLASGIGHVSDLKRRLQMIMRGTTPRSLSWGSLLAVLVLAGFVLPLGPSWGQEKRLFRIVGDRIVEVEPGDPNKPADPTAKAQDEIKKLKEELSKKRWEIVAIEKKLAEAAAKLQRGAGEERHKELRIWLSKDGPRVVGVGTPGQPREIILREVDGKWIIFDPKAPPGVGGPPGAGLPGKMEIRINPNIDLPKLVTPPRPPGQPGTDSRIDQLERKLHELEKLIRDLKKPEALQQYRFRGPEGADKPQPKPQPTPATR